VISHFKFQFPESVKSYKYHVLHSGNDFVADIGGYMGLFLGLSIFGLVEMLTDFYNWWREIMKKTNEKAENEEEKGSQDGPELKKLNDDELVTQT